MHKKCQMKFISFQILCMRNMLSMFKISCFLLVKYRVFCWWNIVGFFGEMSIYRVALETSDRCRPNDIFVLFVVFPLQQMLMSLSGTLGVTLIASNVICASNDEEFVTYMLSSALFSNGICTILMNLIGVR